jgi:predicted RNA-binding protein with PIN domain
VAPDDRARRRWLVDGMNVIGARPDGWWRDRRRAITRLTEALDALAARTGEPVTVVYDGRPQELDARHVDVRFASRSGRNAADDDIAALVLADAEPGTLRVVTSDRALADAVTEAGAEVVGAATFRRRLDGADAKPAKEPERGRRSSVS